MKLSNSNRKYLEHMAAVGRPMDFTEIISVTPRYNGFRHLKSKGLITNVVPDYSLIRNEPYSGPRTAKYVISDKGWKLMAANVAANECKLCKGNKVVQPDNGGKALCRPCPACTEDRREVCKCCNRPNAVGFKVPDHIWEAAVNPEYRDKVLCLQCFDVMATLNGVNWTEFKVEFFPVSGIDGREPIAG